VYREYQEPVGYGAIAAAGVAQVGLFVLTGGQLPLLQGIYTYATTGDRQALEGGAAEQLVINFSMAAAGPEGVGLRSWLSRFRFGIEPVEITPTWEFPAQGTPATRSGPPATGPVPMEGEVFGVEYLRQVREAKANYARTAAELDRANARRAQEPIADPSRLLRGPQRPTWQQTQVDVARDLPGWQTQQSYKKGFPATYGEEGSVRPDLSHPTQPIHIDAKNYDLTSSANRYNLYRDVAHQAQSRAANLPGGSSQGLILDIRGQSIDPAVLRRIPTNIERVTGGLIRAQDVVFKAE